MALMAVHNRLLSAVQLPHLNSHGAESLVVLLCLFQGHLQLGQILLEAIQLHANLLTLLLSPLQAQFAR
jgi:hypothetical protein